MNIDTVLESANILHDDKARRVLNTAPDTYADITLNEIEDGISIERLTALNVPVYQYSTQVTIHGLFKDIPNDLRVAGYKSVTLNGNNSLGVKYVAIDGSKKQLLRDVARYGNAAWHINIDSQGCECYRIFASGDNASDKARTIECYNSTPDNLYIGGKRAVSLMYGGYAVVLHIGAILNDNLWPLIGALTGIDNELEYTRLIAKQADIDKASNERYELECKARRESERAILDNARANFTAPDNWQAFTGKPLAGNTYARVKLDYSGKPVLRVTQYKKRGAFLCSASKDFSDMVYKPWQPSQYSKSLNTVITGWVIRDMPISKPAELSNPKANDITIRHNESQNGIEVIFAAKPPQPIIDTLKGLGFRWSQYNGLWYNRYNESLLNSVNSLLAGG